MHKVYPAILLFTLLSMASVEGMAQKNPAKPAANTPAATQPAVKLRSFQDSVQYALGAFVGQFMLKSGFLEVNLDYFIPGITDVFTKKQVQLNDSLTQILLRKYQNSSQKQIGKKLEEVLFENLKSIPNLGKLPSGVQYVVVKPGSGNRPLEADSVVIHFQGGLPDGTLFEDSYARKSPMSTTPASLIPGLNEVLQLMQVGAIWQVYIPASMAYGEKGGIAVPPNSAVVIRIELLEIKKK